MERFIGPACVIDDSPQVCANADFLLTQALVEEWESRHGRIPSRAWVLIRTDWSKQTGESLSKGALPCCSYLTDDFIDRVDYNLGLQMRNVV